MASLPTATAAPSLHSVGSSSPRRLRRRRHRPTIASAIGSSRGSRSTSVRVVAAPWCRSDRCHALVNKTGPPGSTVHDTPSPCRRHQDPRCAGSGDRYRLPLCATADRPAPHQHIVLAAVVALALVSGTAPPATSRSPALLIGTFARLHCGDLDTIPIARPSPSGSVQSGFNEVAPCCEPLSVPRDLTEASRFTVRHLRV